jgi:hypothetical protein
MIRNWLSRKETSSHKTRQAGARRRRRICTLEGLEDRRLLSSSPTPFLVTDTSDSAADTGSLRHAIDLANANTNTAGSLITFAPSVFNTTTPQVITLLSGTLDLKEMSGPELIDGPGASLLTIWGNDTYQGLNVAGGVTASLTGLTIERGYTTLLNGGGIEDDGTLAVTNCTIADNVSGGMGGGIYDGGALTVTGSTIQGNVSKGGVGGGLDVDADATANITDSTIEGNSATGAGSVGGGIAVTVDSALMVINSTVGGASSSEINSSSLYGGGIYNGSGCTLTITGSTIEGNSVSAVGSDGGGIENDTDGTLTLADSTVAGNSAKGLGGGIQTSGTTAVVTNSTIAGNSAEFGGGIETEKVVTVYDSTIADNTATMAGGGLLVDNGATATLDNTIIAQNLGAVSVLAGGATASDVDNAGTLSGSYNLIGTGGAGGLVNGNNGNQVGVASPGLGPLANNGGPTDTITLLPGSPASDHGSNLLIPAGVTTDQRGPGFARIFNGTVDIGAFELQPAAIVAVTVDWGVDSATILTAADGLRLLPAGRNTDLPWLDINQLQITLNQADTLTQADVTVKGIKVKNYGPVAISGSGTNYTITLARPIKVADRVTITITAPDFVTYTRRLDVLPGDFDDNGLVNNNDVKGVSNELHRTGGAQPTIFGDIVGDGTVDARDLKATRQHAGTRLPRLTGNRSGAR